MPAHTIKFWAFFGMLAQVPLIIITDFLTRALQGTKYGANWGNVIFWISFCVFGQPLGVLLYYHHIQSEGS